MSLALLDRARALGLDRDPELQAALSGYVAAARQAQACVAQHTAWQAAEEEVQLQREAVTSFAAFVRYMWPTAVPGDRLVWEWFYDAICQEIEDLYAESDRRRALVEAILEEHADDGDAAAAAIEAQLGGLPRLRLVIMIPPRHGKSALVSKLLPAWRWLHRPQDRFLSLACREGLVVRDGLAMRDVVTSERYKALQQIAGQDFALRDDQRAKSKFDNTAGGSRTGHAIGAGWVGVDAESIVVDDPHDVDEVLSEVASPESIARELARIGGIYKRKLRDRLSSKIYGVILCIMQRLADRDLADIMAKEPGARVVCLPALYDPDHPHVYADDPRTEEGQPLNPKRFPRSDVEREMQTDPRGAAAKQQQRPVPKEGGTFQRRWFSKRYSEPPRALAISAGGLWVSVDAAKKNTATADYYSIQGWAQKGRDFPLLFDVRRRMDYPEFERLLDRILLACRHELAGVLLEDTVHGTTYLQCWADPNPNRQAPRVIMAPVLPFHPSKDTPGKDKSKMARAMYLARAAEGGQILLPDEAALAQPILPADLVEPGWDGQWLDEICGFPYGPKKDRVDTASQLIMRFVLQGGVSNAIARTNQVMASLFDDLGI